MDILGKICILRIMDFELFRGEVRAEIFDYQYLAEHMKNLKKPRDKVSSLVAEGKIVRVKKGVYVFGEKWRRAPLSLEVVANVLYGPSCISFEYALTRYGLLAERSLTITCLTIGDTKTFQTPLGIFEYRAIDREKFKIGLEYRNLGEEGGYLVASKEKALADLVYRTPGIRTLGQLDYFLFEEMRVDETMFQELDKEAFRAIAKIYKKKSVIFLGQL
jgi:predicted transcriptional regulator of viral defense system